MRSFFLRQGLSFPFGEIRKFEANPKANLRISREDKRGHSFQEGFSPRELSGPQIQGGVVPKQEYRGKLLGIGLDPY
jgi:hypothetical protein